MTATAEDRKDAGDGALDADHPGRAWLAPTILVVGAVAGCAYVATHDPNDPSEPMLKCPTKLITGLDCPFCGGLRLVRALLTGQWSAAIHANLLLLVCLPFVLYAWTRWLVASVTGGAYSVRIPRRAGYAVLAVALVWTVVRNLPGFPLQPLG